MELEVPEGDGGRGEEEDQGGRSHHGPEPVVARGLIARE